MRNESAGAAQVCRASPEARAWVLQRLFEFIDGSRPDYLKWDNNFWINCSRGGHGHGPEDGGFAHVRGLYAVFAALRNRYPDLLIENCSGGGRRLDLEMLRYTDVGWMDNRTAPSLHVRHNLEGLSAAFPPAYLFSFVMEHPTEPLRDSPDLSLAFRSRMPGVLGLTYPAAGFTEGEVEQIKREIRIYKMMRGIVQYGRSILLTPQASAGSGQWDAVQVLSRSRNDAVILAFDDRTGPEQVVVHPKGLDPQRTYIIMSIDEGVLGAMTGSTLMSVGLEITASSLSAAHGIMLRAMRRMPP